MSFWLVIVRVFILPFTWAEVQPDPRLKTEREKQESKYKGKLQSQERYQSE